MPNNVRQKQYKRAETYEEMMSDLASTYDEDLLRVIDSYIHSPLLTERVETPQDQARRDFGTIKILLHEAYAREQEECSY